MRTTPVGLKWNLAHPLARGLRLAYFFGQPGRPNVVGPGRPSPGGGTYRPGVRGLARKFSSGSPELVHLLGSAGISLSRPGSLFVRLATTTNEATQRLFSKSNSYSAGSRSDGVFAQVRYGGAGDTAVVAAVYESGNESSADVVSGSRSAADTGEAVDDVLGFSARDGGQYGFLNGFVSQSGTATAALDGGDTLDAWFGADTTDGTTATDGWNGLAYWVLWYDWAVPPAMAWKLSREPWAFLQGDDPLPTPAFNMSVGASAACYQASPRFDLSAPAVATVGGDNSLSSTEYPVGADAAGTVYTNQFSYVLGARARARIRLLINDVYTLDAGRYRR